jgi:hypothetical protein
MIGHQRKSLSGAATPTEAEPHISKQVPDSHTAAPNLKTKLLTMAGLITVELIGGLVVLALWGVRYV